MFKFPHAVSGFSEGATHNGYFIGNDLNQDGMISLDAGEIFDFIHIFGGTSSIPMVTFTPDNIDLSQSNAGVYSYGTSILDNSDDVSFNFTLFLQDNANNLFVKAESNNTYPNSGVTTITKYTTNDFSIVEAIETTNQVNIISGITPIPESTSFLGLLVVGVFILSVECKKNLRKD